MNSTFSDLLVLLAIAVLLVWCFRRLHLPAILAYLVAGIIAGPDVTAIIADPDAFHFVAELGVVLLLFSLGLEFSLVKMIAMRRLVFGLGSAQMLGCMLLFILLCVPLVGDWGSAIAIAGALALSSTAVVIKQLAETAQINSRRGQLSVAILLFQDLAVVPLLILIPLLSATAGDQGIAYALMLALLKAAAVIAILLAVGKWVLPLVFREVARLRTDELFVLTTLLVALVAGGLTHLFGLSMALGAFLAGMMLGESKYKHQLEADIRPFRDILMGLFFTTIGMQLSLPDFFAQLHWVVLALLVMAAIKVAVIYGLTRMGHERPRDSLATALSLFQMGEFGFVIIALAFKHQLLSDSQASLMIGIGVFGMALTPLLIERLPLILNRVMPHRVNNAETDVNAIQETPAIDVIICGFGRVGQTVSRFVEAEGLNYFAIDHDPLRVQEAMAGGAKVLFGDASKRDILKALGIERAKRIVISFSDDDYALRIIRLARELNDDIDIIVRSRDDLRLEQLQQAGASQVVPDTLEAALMLIAHILTRSGVPIRRVLARLEQERRNHYGDMHGFFPGEMTAINSAKSESLNLLKAVSLPDNAFAVGNSLQALNLRQFTVELRALRRADIELEAPTADMFLQAADVLLISGTPADLEACERYLLAG